MTTENKNQITEIKPSKELIEGNYRWFLFDETQTGLPLLCIEDIETGLIATTPLSNLEKRSAAHKAWSGARHSRAPGKTWEIMAEMGEKGVDPDQKLEEMFISYGHASVGDMARIQVNLENSPMHLAFALFNIGTINSGQEKSTRYQPQFKGSRIHELTNYKPENVSSNEWVDLSDGYKELSSLALELFEQNKEVITNAFATYYKPETEKEMGSLKSRVLDCVRYFLPFGHMSGLTYETSARDFSRIIGELRASPLGFYQQAGFLIEKLLTPSKEIENQLGFKAEAPGLIKHTEAQTQANENIKHLQEYLSTKTDILSCVRINKTFKGRQDQGVLLIDNSISPQDRMVAQYVLSIYPGMEKSDLLRWIKNTPSDYKEEIGRIIFNKHNSYHEQPTELSRTTNLGFIFEATLGELRDFNRHKPWGRFLPLPLIHGVTINHDTALQVLANGYCLPLYFEKIEEFNALKSNFVKDLDSYYKRVYQYMGKVFEKFGDNIDYSFIINLLPLAHKFDLWMHGDAKQAVYFQTLRIRNGVHINCRALTHCANKLLVESDPLFKGIEIDRKPDPADRKEFFDRS